MKLRALLSWAWKKFYNLGAWKGSQYVSNDMGYDVF